MAGSKTDPPYWGYGCYEEIWDDDSQKDKAETVSRLLYEFEKGTKPSE